MSDILSYSASGMHSDILLTFCLAFFLACILTFFLAFTLILSGIYSGILFGILSVILCGIDSGIHQVFYVASILTFSLWQFYDNLSGRWSGARDRVRVQAAVELDFSLLMPSMTMTRRKDEEWRSEGRRCTFLLKSRDTHLAGGESNHIPRVEKDAPRVGSPTLQRTWGH